MFPQFKKINNESGIVLFIVLMTAIVIMILSVGILTQSMNETNYAQQQIDQITCDQCAKGMFWNAYANEMNGPQGGVCAGINRVYNVTTTSSSGTDGITSYNVVCNYDTLQ